MTDRASSSTLSLSRASSLEPLRVSGRASPPAILRWYDTTSRELENEKGEGERKRKVAAAEGRRGCRESWGRMYLASLHWLRAFGQHLALHRRAYPRKNPTERPLTIPVATCLNFLPRRDMVNCDLSGDSYEDVLIRTRMKFTKKAKKKVTIYLISWNFILGYIKEYSKWLSNKK